MDGLRARLKNFVEHPDSVRFGTPAEDVRVMEDANAANVLDALSDIEIRLIGENDT
jgi:hypothetical protein